MKRILFIDNVFENGIPRYEFKALPNKVSDLTHIQVSFRTTPPDVQEINEENTLRYDVSEFDEYDLIFIHDSYDSPTIKLPVMNHLADRYANKLYRFSGYVIPERNGLKRDYLYDNLVSFLRFIDRYNQIDLQIISEGPTNYLEKKYNELLDEISDFDNWKHYLTENWWFYLQDYFKLPDEDTEEMKEEINAFEYFSDFDLQLEKVKNQAYRRLFL